ncbi:MAG: IS66 family insertion sequence element accessory protein TnpB [Myxococcota bacterium]
MLARGRRSVFAAAQPTDLSELYDTLAHLVKSELGQDPAFGAMFLFVNRACTRANVLWWDGTGLCILQKRLERGRFAAPWKRAYDGVIRITENELNLSSKAARLRSSVSYLRPRFGQRR